MNVVAAIMIKNDTRELYLSNYEQGYPAYRGKQLLNTLSELYKDICENNYISIDRIAFSLAAESRKYKPENCVIPRAEYLYIIF